MADRSRAPTAAPTGCPGAGPGRSIGVAPASSAPSLQVLYQGSYEVSAAPRLRPGRWRLYRPRQPAARRRPVKVPSAGPLTVAPDEVKSCYELRSEKSPLGPFRSRFRTRDGFAMASVVTHAFRPFRQRRIWVFTAVTALAATAALVASPASRASAAATLLSQGQPATASSVQSASYPASAAVDGNTGTRWSSAFSDPQWLQVDLGSSASITQVVLQWEAAYATAFQTQTSSDGTNWTTIYSTTTGTGGTQTLNVTGTGRYVRMYGTARATAYGYSLWEFQVYGSLSGGSTCGTTDAALNQPTTASSVQNATLPASAAVDGNTSTRWSSAFSDPQWLQVDLGSTKTICQVSLNWEAAYAKAFQIQTSPDGTNWTTIFSTTTGTGGVQTLNVSGTGRYIRMYGTTRATAYGYSLWEFDVYTTSSGGGGGNTVTVTNPGSQNSTVGTAASLQIAATDSASGQTLTYSAAGLPAGLSINSSSGLISGTPTTAATTSATVTVTDTTGAAGTATFSWTVATGGSGVCPAQSNTPNFGPNVDIFDPSMSSASIQSTLDSVFNTQKLNQFGTQRYALLFKPGTYSAEANIGYYTSIQGLGQNPDDVTINGDVTVDSF